jgi:hypothetical protein
VVLAIVGVAVVGLAILGFMLLGGNGSGTTGSVKIVSVGQAPEPLGMVKVVATFEVTGPTKNAVVVCRFSGQHMVGAGQSQANGWIVYTRIADLQAGESTQATCDALSWPSVGEQAPSEPVVSITTVGNVGQPPTDWEVQYAPPTPWP